MTFVVPPPTRFRYNLERDCWKVPIHAFVYSADLQLFEAENAFQLLGGLTGPALLGRITNIRNNGFDLVGYQDTVRFVLYDSENDKHLFYAIQPADRSHAHKTYWVRL